MATVLKEYKILISSTKSDLVDRLGAIDSRLISISSRGKIAVDVDMINWKRIQEERDSTRQCIKICFEISGHIDRVRPDVFRDITSATGVTSYSVTTLDELISARSATADALTKSTPTLSNTTAHLEQHLHTMDSHLQVLHAENEGSTAEEMAENMKDEYDSAKHSLEFSTQASERAIESRVNSFEDVSPEEDGHQAIISTFGDLISAKRVSAEPRSTQWMGQLSDESFQQLTKTLGRLSAEKQADTQAGATRPFENRFVAAFPLNARKPSV